MNAKHTAKKLSGYLVSGYRLNEFVCTYCMCCINVCDACVCVSVLCEGCVCSALVKEESSLEV